MISAFKIGLYRAGSVFLIAIIVLNYSCAAILTPKNKKNIVIRTEEKDAQIFVDKVEIDTLRNTVTLKNDMSVHDVEVTKKGYKTHHDVLFQTRVNPLIFVNIPFLIFPLVGVLGLMGDLLGDKTRLYEKEFNYPSLTRLPEKKEGQKYILVSKTAVHIGQGEQIGTGYNYKQYKNNKEGYPILADEKIDYDNTNLTYELNALLVEYGFTDTTQQLIPNNLNSVYVNCEIVDFSASRVYFSGKSDSEHEFYELTLKVDWTLTDVYDNELLSVTTTGKSDRFSSAYEFRDVVGDALEKSLIDMINDNAVQEVLEKGDEEVVTAVSYSELVIEKPEFRKAKLNETVKSVVTVKTDDGHGSGSIISKDGYVITNYHVVGSRDTVEIIFNDESKAVGVVKRKDAKADLALVKVDGEYRPLVVDEMRDLNIGSDVWAIGTPNDITLGQTLSKGIISGERLQNGMTYIQTDVSINSGNSGGALVDTSGNLIGIINAKLVGFGIEGIGFAIPSWYIKERLNITFK